ncbi:Na(+)/citrate cotransporter [Patella vulgata]|uniref:Na(+)/citrate cotransporter n=1 Tax=Patella vulgata TaxID=6465 RepID=UPI00218083A2|nr:Na(+)/citrate cotransporter [Patella vulgata]
MSLLTFLRELWLVKKTLIVIFTPIIFLPIAVLGQTIESRCAYGLSIMTVYWITEALPLACTALLPVLIFPLLEVQPVGKICANYIKDASMFGFSCLTFAIAVEKCRLHKRIALRTLLLAGSNPKWLMLGFMVPTWFMSMWMSNTATTAMMLPIVQAVLQELDPAQHKIKGEEEHDLIDNNLSKRGSSILSKRHPFKTEEDNYKKLCKGMCICVAYAANIGGSGSLSGTSPNLILQGQAEIIFSERGLDSGVNFVSWMIFALPGSVISVILAWLWLSLFFMGPRKWMKWKCGTDEGVGNLLKRQYDELGPITFAEKSVVAHFVVLIVLWLSKKPPVVPGWGSFFPRKYVGDSAVAVLLCLSLFVFPSERPKTLFFKRKSTDRGETVPALLDWKTVEKNYPWGVLLLLGGGYALAGVCQDSGLSTSISQYLHVFVIFEPWLMNFFLTILVSICTEVTSNTATSAILIPIMAQLAVGLSINPLYLMWSCCIATSFAFMLPVATPPNAIVFATGHLQVKDMVLSGSVLNFLCVIVLNLGVNTWGKAYFNLGVIPPEFLTNTTSFAVGSSSANGTMNFTDIEQPLQTISQILNISTIV